MLLDHIGVVFFPKNVLFRIVGRMAFPIFCFLLVEGLHYTKDRKKYMLRLFLMAILSEIPFDAAFYGRFPYWHHQNVMMTLLLGACALVLMDTIQEPMWKCLCVIPFLLAAKLAYTDYAQWGVAMIVLLGIARQRPSGRVLQYCMIILICCLMQNSDIIKYDYPIPIQAFGSMSVLPIMFYSGKKQTSNKAIQWSFYLFYPLHLMALWLISTL